MDDTPPIDSRYLVGAWLDAHFMHPFEKNPLTTGLKHRPPPSSLGSDPLSSGSTSPQGSTCTDAGGHGEPLVKRPCRTFNTAAAADPRDSYMKLPLGFGGGVGGTVGGGQNIVAGTRDHSENSSDQGAGDIATTAPVESSTRQTFAAALSASDLGVSAKKRKTASKSSSPSKAPTSYSDVRRKRAALEFCDPAGTFGIPDLAENNQDDQLLIPDKVIAVLRHFSPSNFEFACIPRTPEIDSILERSFPHERYLPHTRLDVTSDEDHCRAKELVNFANRIHRACLLNSRRGEDEAAWYPLVRSLLSVELPPPKSTSVIPAPSPFPYWPTRQDPFLTIDATTKLTVNTPPINSNIKLDALLAFNPKHHTYESILQGVRAAGIRVNAFNDVGLEGTVIVLGVEVKSTGGAGGEMDAEYQVGVWGMKTLHLTRSLAQSESTSNCDLALSLSVCGHVWSLHVTYWRSGAELVTHGPVVVGSTDSFYGTMKIIAFVKRLKEWARDEFWGDWKSRLEAVQSAVG